MRAKFVELETLSPMYTFHPGKDYCHTEQWYLLEQAFEARNWQSIKAALPRGEEFDLL